MKKVFRACKKKPVTVHAYEMDENFSIQTPEGLMKGSKGDYLIRGVKGEFYPIKREIFHETYDWEDGEEEFNWEPYTGI